MDWKNEEVDEARSGIGWGELLTAGVARKVMTRAVELKAAGGTMTADDLEALAKSWHGATVPEAFIIRKLLGHISTLGARNAVLEARAKHVDAEAARVAEERDVACQLAATRLKDRMYIATEMEKLKERLSAAEEGNRELVRRAKQAESSLLHANKTVLELRTALAEAQEQHRQSERKHANLSTAGQAGEKSAAVQMVELAVEAGLPVRFVPQRYPCSPTCTHDDAATPGHPERVKERSEAVNAVTGAPDPVGTRAVKAGAKPGREIASYRAGYEQGCDDMRAACLEATDAALAQLGITDPGVRVVLRRHIEGAAP